METASRPSNLTASFEYLQWDPLYEVEKPFQVFIDIPKDCPDQRKDNLTFNSVAEETILDVRGNDNHFTLDGNGFAYLKRPSKLSDPSDFYDVKRVEEVYLLECAEVLERELDDVGRLRHSNTTKKSGQKIDFNDRTIALGPARNPHVDTSAASVVDMVNLYLPEEAEELLQDRVRVINLWRPISGPVLNWPLAVVDGNTVAHSSFIETNRIRRQYTGCTLFSTYQEGVKWYYMSRQMPEDLLLFKNFDSKDGVAQYAAHAAVPPKDKTEASLRESIEVRALVFTSTGRKRTET